MSTTTKSVSLFQIAYESAESVTESGFLILDNTSNLRPDWYEYWPIRNFFLNKALVATDFLGFFSPKFHVKTGLTCELILDFMAQDEFASEVYLFSPQPEVGALFLNVFESENFFTPGFRELSQRVVKHLGFDHLDCQAVMDSRQTVFSNYLIASPRFWSRWLSVCEALFGFCEAQRSDAPDLQSLLLRPTNYPGGAQAKVFLMERIASLVISSEGFITKAYNPFRLASSAHFAPWKAEAVACDALKRSYLDTKHPEYLDVFHKVSNATLQQFLSVKMAEGSH